MMMVPMRCYSISSGGDSSLLYFVKDIKSYFTGLQVSLRFMFQFRVRVRGRIQPATGEGAQFVRKYLAAKQPTNNSLSGGGGGG